MTGRWPGSAKVTALSRAGASSVTFLSNSRQQSFRQVLFRASARLYDDGSLKRFDNLDKA
jgi:hypothetical protein